jgi:dolichol-phosphate mannosyltransferase
MLSIVVPVFNEAESLPQLQAELRSAATSLGHALDVLLVDDGSNDGSWQVIQQLAATNPDVRGIRLRRNFGKAAALSAGFRAARGELVLSIDADLQDDPAEIPRLMEKLGQNLDVVSGWKQVRRDPWHKVWPSRVFNWLVGRLTGVRLHDHNCGMKLYRAEVLREVRLYGELHRFVPVLAHARGFRVGEVAIAHRARKFGRSKYGVERLLKGFRDLLTVKFLTGYGQRPQHVLGTIGMLSFCIGAAGMTYLAGYWLVTQIQAAPDRIPLHQRPALVYCVGALLLGGQFLSIGLIAELITAYHGREADTYSIAEVTTSSSTSSPVISPASSESASS